MSCENDKKHSGTVQHKIEHKAISAASSKFKSSIKRIKQNMRNKTSLK